MAEYINREEFGKQILFESNRIQNKQMTTGLSDAYGMLWDFPKADVVERSKVDEAIEDMERYSVAADYEGEKEISKAIDKCVEILKRNIGE